MFFIGWSHGKLFRKPFNETMGALAAMNAYPDAEQQTAFLDGALFMYGKRNSAGTRVVQDEAIRACGSDAGVEQAFETVALYQKRFHA